MKVEVHLLGGLRKIIDIDPYATRGAVVGKNLFFDDGTIVTRADFGGGSAPDDGTAITSWELILNIPPNVVALAGASGTGLFAVTGASTGAMRTLADSATIEWANGDGVAGNPVASLKPLPDTGIGAALVKQTRDAYGRVEGTEAATTDDLDEGDSNLYFTDARADARITLQKGQPLGLATLDANSKLDPGQLPALAITETFVVNTEAAMLALDCQQGDVAVRTDLSKSLILTAEPASTLGNWQDLLTPTSPVASVFGRTGSVTAATGDYTPAQVGADPAGSAATAQAAAQSYADGKVASTITNGDTTHAPSGDTVFDALAGKADDASVVHNAGTENIGGNKTFIGTPIMASGTAIMSAAAGSNRSFRFQTSGVDRWVFGASGGAESGGNAGSSFFINQYSDAGSLIGTPLTLDRATGNFRWRGTFEFSPDNACSVGAPGFRSSVVYSATGAINTSDAREKTAVVPLTESEIAYAKQLAGEIGTFQWLVSIGAKGSDNARHHVGVTVQRCIELAQAHGLDPFRYAFICYDEWDETPEQWSEWPEEQDDAGNVIRESGRELVQEYQPAGDRYSLRPDQLALFLARGFDARLKALEG